MKHPDEDLRNACRERCAEFGDPPCYDLVEDPPAVGPWVACSDCLADCGVDIAAPLDPGAVVRPLF